LKKLVPTNKPHTSADYEQLGKMLVNIYESGYVNKNQTYKSSFLKGALGGFGGVLGATILVALLLWLMSYFKTVPFIGPIVKNAQQTIENSNTKH